MLQHLRQLGGRTRVQEPRADVQMLDTLEELERKVIGSQIRHHSKVGQDLAVTSVIASDENH